jgi:ABC-2 type transport system ATP-binding protein
MCDSLLFIDQGRIVHHGTAASLQHREGPSACLLDIQVHGSEQPLVEWLSMHPGWELVAAGRHSVRAEFHSGEREVLAEQLRRMIIDGILVVDFHRQERRLEDIFVDVLKQNNNGTPSVPPPLPVLTRA